VSEGVIQQHRWWGRGTGWRLKSGGGSLTVNFMVSPPNVFVMDVTLDTSQLVKSLFISEF